MKTDQIRRLFFPQVTNSLQASKTAALKKMNHFRAQGLVDHLPRQYNKQKYGAQMLIWHLTEAGQRLLDLHKDTDGKRHRYLEPSVVHLGHTLAVVECYVQTTEICRTEPLLSLKALRIEPECWRSYEKNTRSVSLRPDLYAETINSKYVDHWFIEMDLGTESMREIMQKCRRYHEYYQTNKEQHAIGVYPVVLWIVPDNARKEKMIQTIKETFSARYAHIFLVITPDQYKGVLVEGAKMESLC